MKRDRQRLPMVQEVTCGEHGLGRGSKDDDPQFWTINGVWTGKVGAIRCSVAI